MDRRAFALGACASTLGLSACGSTGRKSPRRFRTYNGPEVTSVVINKGHRRMYLLHNDEILKEYKVDLGFAPAGDKRVKGDGRTPEGTYVIDRRNPNSAFHLSIGISYPNAKDIAEAKALGQEPGGDIFIHGQPNRERAKGRDWTAGCIAVKNGEMEEIYAMVKNGTPVALRP
ncbi:MAG: L,D-transpeptidase family protein [Mangrovicoccus sp.]|nr:L,D-transpeptidase family protein [Mangrovicoccus sp.]